MIRWRWKTFSFESIMGFTRNNKVGPKLELTLFGHKQDAILHTTTAILIENLLSKEVLVS